MILDALKILGPEYSAAMEKAFDERWIDYSDNIGKQSGAFVPPHMLLTRISY